MNNMAIPKYIDVMAPTMCPVALKINYNKSNDIDKPGFFNGKQGKMAHHPAITDNADAKP